MDKTYLSLQEAADLSKKSIQTIRRAIKSKRLKIKKSKTPQGFNYLVEKDSLIYFYGMGNGVKDPGIVNENVVEENLVQEKVEEVKNEVSEKMSIETSDFKALIKTLESLLNQHNDERQNYLRLVNTLQEKIYVLENQLNLLKAPEKKWYNFWK